MMDPETCPNPDCEQKNVPPSNTTTDGLRFRRCPTCSWSWFTRVKATTNEGEVT